MGVDGGRHGRGRGGVEPLKFPHSIASATATSIAAACNARAFALGLGHDRGAFFDAIEHSARLIRAGFADSVLAVAAHDSMGVVTTAMQRGMNVSSGDAGVCMLLTRLKQPGPVLRLVGSVVGFAEGDTALPGDVLPENRFLVDTLVGDGPGAAARDVFAAVGATCVYRAARHLLPARGRRQVPRFWSRGRRTRAEKGLFSNGSGRRASNLYRLEPSLRDGRTEEHSDDGPRRGLVRARAGHHGGVACQIGRERLKEEVELVEQRGLFEIREDLGVQRVAAILRRGDLRDDLVGVGPDSERIDTRRGLIMGQRDPDLPQVGLTLSPSRRLSRRLHGRQEERDQNTDDANDDEQLDQREARGS